MLNVIFLTNNSSLPDQEASSFSQRPAVSFRPSRHRRRKFRPLRQAMPRLSCLSLLPVLTSMAHVMGTRFRHLENILC